MKRQLLKNSAVMFVVTVFFLMAGVALAEKKHWYVVKDKDGVCKVIETETVPEPLKTLAGPLETMEEAEKIKAKECPKGAGPAPQQLRHQQEQGERIRHQQEQAEPMKGKVQENKEGAKSSGEKIQEKTKDPIPSDKKN